MQSLSSFVPRDRLHALAKGEELPECATGAALCADISGFTPLTERLLQDLGARAGAEELTRLLNITYGALIAEVHRYAGCVIGFSGDAITCWFDEDSGLRAVACALAMQRVMSGLSERSPHPDKVPPVSIRVGVSRGRVRRLRVGDPEIQYVDVLAGHTLDRLEMSVGLADKGEVVACEDVIASIEQRADTGEWRVPTSSDRRFATVAALDGLVEAQPWPAHPGLSEEQILDWLLPPVHERLRQGDDRFLAELRPSVALFLKLEGIAYDKDTHASERLDGFIRWVQNVLFRYDGYMIQLSTGDKGTYLYASFGALVAHDDDEARAVMAAVELLSPPNEIGLVQRIQIGISKGLTWAGSYGSETRQTYGVLGNEVNVAARLMELARPGEILVRDCIADACREVFHFRNLKPVHLEGVKEPLTPFSLIDRRIERRRFDSPLVGRSSEIAHLERALDVVQSTGRGRTMVVTGEPGTGKSHLATEFCHRAIDRGWQTAMGVCQSTGQGIAYSPWRQVFRTVLKLTDEPLAGEDVASWNQRQASLIETEVRNGNPEWEFLLPLLGDLLGLSFSENPTTEGLDPHMRQQATVSLAADVIDKATQERPLILVIEDVHWMDEASRRLAAELIRTIVSRPVVLVLTRRPELTRLLTELEHPDKLEELNLTALPSPYIEEIVSRHLEGKPDAAVFSLGQTRAQIRVAALVSSLIQARAQGNPFFARELVDALCESGDLQLQDDGTWTLSDSLLASLRDAHCLVKSNGGYGLDPKANLPAHIGIPDSVHRTVLARIDRLPEEHKLTLKVASVIGRSFELDLLESAHPQRPEVHVLVVQLSDMEIRNLVMPEMAASQRVFAFQHNIVHDVTYASLPDTQQHELHCSVGQALESLAPQAVERLAYHYTRSLERDKTLLYLGKAAHKMRREYANEMALQYYQQALRFEDRWEWRKGQVEVLHILGKREQERGLLEVLAARPDSEAFDAAYLWAGYYEAIGSYLEAQSAIHRAIEACQSPSRNMDSGRCLIKLGLISGRQGEYDEAKAYLQQALDVLETQADDCVDERAQVLNGLGTVFRQQNRYAEARDCHEQALELSRRTGNRVIEGQTLNDLGNVAFYQRDFGAALVHYRRSLEVRRACGDRAGVGGSLYSMGLATRDAGDYGEAQRYLMEAHRVHQTTGDRWQEVNVWNALGQLHLRFGELSKAQACLERGQQLSQEIGDDVGQAYVLGNLGQVLCERGDYTSAQQVLLEGLELAQVTEDQHSSSFIFSYLGTVNLMAGRFEPAIEWANRAIDARGDHQRLLTTADLATMAVAHQSLGRHREALESAQRCLALLEQGEGRGSECPQRDFFLCYRVLLDNDRAEQARSALRIAYQQIMNRADKISDPGLRTSFLHDVRVNREIIEEYQRLENR